MNRKIGIWAFSGILVAMAWVGSAAMAGDGATVMADPVAEAQTLSCIGAYWIVGGDDNRNAQVKVEYRQAGQGQWLRGPDMFRVEKKKSQPARFASQLKVPSDAWLFAGSVLAVESGKDYEMRLTLSDPDGGAAQKTIRCATKAEPVVSKDWPRLHVVPGKGGGSGTAADPFKGVAGALKAARPPVVIAMHAGTYEAFEAELKGSEGQPIVIAAAGDGEVVVDAKGKSRGIGLNDSTHVWVEGLTVRGAEYGIVANGASNIVVRRCRVLECRSGIWAAGKKSGVQAGFIVCDNLLTGTHSWDQERGAAGDEHRGINLAGMGHSICYNRVSGFKDGIDVWPSARTEAIDINNNDVSDCQDDGSEMDYSERNTRNFCNRYVNVFQGISIQPVYGGPVYVVRNVLYNVAKEPFKMHNMPSGGLFIHNTVVKSGPPLMVWTSDPIHNIVLRNNLFIGTEAEVACDFEPKMKDCDFDYDGYGGGPWRAFLQWSGASYPTIAEAQARSGIYKHLTLIDSAKVFASGLRAPETADKWQDPRKIDVRLAAGSDAIDAGTPIAGFNDGFAGKAPDLGAYEAGAPAVQYGPRVKFAPQVPEP